MPYISKGDRDRLALGLPPTKPGELNYVITMEIQKYLNTNGLSYQTINDISGVLDCVKAEFYRRIVIPYEDKKMKENGDVYK